VRFWQESVLLIRIIGSQRYSLDPTSKMTFGESDVSRIISYSYHYRFISRLTLSYGIREVINPRNLVFPPAEICAVDVEFSFQNGRGGGRVCARGPPHVISLVNNVDCADLQQATQAVAHDRR